MNLSPEQMIRRYLDEHGGDTDATVRHLLTTFGIDDADQDGRDRIRRALFAVGVGMDRQLPFLHPDERIHLSVADRPSTHTAPTPLGTAATGDQAQTGESQVKGGPAQQHPAGWYADPSGGRQRYWDGTRWTEHYAAGPQPQMKASKSASLTEQPRAFWLAAAGAALMIIGGLGPWATAFGTLDISGTKGDGWIVVGAGALGLVALWFFFAGQRRLALAVLAGLCGLAGAGTAIYDREAVGRRLGGILRRGRRSRGPRVGNLRGSCRVVRPKRRCRKARLRPPPYELGPPLPLGVTMGDNYGGIRRGWVGAATTSLRIPCQLAARSSMLSGTERWPAPSRTGPSPRGCLRCP
jgi:uncharacterized protein DUF2510